MKYRKARKTYACCMCGGSIKVGQEYCDHGNGQRECWRCVGG